MAVDTVSKEAAFSSSRTDSGCVVKLHRGFHLDLARELSSSIDGRGVGVAGSAAEHHLSGADRGGLR